MIVITPNIKMYKITAKNTTMIFSIIFRGDLFPLKHFLILLQMILHALKETYKLKAKHTIITAGASKAKYKINSKTLTPG
jgi:hypothetical protein